MRFLYKVVRTLESFLSFRNYLWLDIRGFLFDASGRIRGSKNVGIINS